METILKLVEADKRYLVCSYINFIFNISTCILFLNVNWKELKLFSFSSFDSGSYFSILYMC